MKQAKKYATIHPVGVGGTGCNIVEVFIKDPRTITRYISGSELSQLAALAIDIAHGDIDRLQTTYMMLKNKLEKEGISERKFRVIASSLKFPSPRAFYDFIQLGYKKFLEQEGIENIDEKYKPLLINPDDIPPLSGGVARKRGLAKFIYAMNYYQLGTVVTLIESFKEVVTRNPTTNIIGLIFGVGGGTGSGIVPILARHLKKHFGGALPIVGIGVLPVEADDPGVKISAYIALNELKFLLDRKRNEFMLKKFGPTAENPFYAFFFIPQRNVYLKVHNLQLTHEMVDQEIADVLHALSSIDLADALDHLYSEVPPDGFITVIVPLKLYYPIDRYVDILKLRISELDNFKTLLDTLFKITNESLEIINDLREELKETYSKILQDLGEYREDYVNEFMDKIRRSSRYEKNMSLRLDDVTNGLLKYGEPLIELVLNLRVEGMERHTIDTAKKIVDLIKSVKEDFENKIREIEILCNDLEDYLNTATRFTPHQKDVLRQFVKLIRISVNVLKFIKEFVFISEALRELETRYPDKLNNTNIIRNTTNSIVRLITTLIMPPLSQIKYLDGIRAVISSVKKSSIEVKRTGLEEMLYSLERRKRHLRQELEEVETKLRKKILPFGKKDLIRRRDQLEKELKKLKDEYEETEEKYKKIERIDNFMANIVKNLSLGSDYRKTLDRIVELERKVNELLEKVASQEKMFTRVVELSKKEQIRAMELILRGESSKLKDEKALVNIIDRDRFNEIMRTVIDQLKNPATLGVKPTFRTKRIWVTVLAPSDLWTEELRKEIETALSGYVMDSVSQVVAFRESPPVDPWTVSIIVLMSGIRIEDLDIYDILKQSYTNASDKLKYLMSSLMIEFGLTFEQLEKMYQEEMKQITS